MNGLWVALGGALGALCRYWLNNHVVIWLGRGFPYGILIVNVLGSFLIGLAFYWLVTKGLLNEWWRGMLILGFLGALTTFSSFSLDTVQLIQEGAVTKALLYIVSSVGLCLFATFFGIWLAKALS